MNVHLEQDEVSALLEQQAFAPSKWRKGLFWLQMVLLLLACSYAVSLYRLESLSPLHPDKPASLLLWQQGSSRSLEDQKLSRCLVAWGQKRRLPAAQQIIISITPDSWYLAWVSTEGSINFYIKGHIQELCP